MNVWSKNYSETCIKGTPARVPNFSFHIYCKMNLYTADTDTEMVQICHPKPVLSGFYMGCLLYCRKTAVLKIIVFSGCYLAC